MVKLVRLQHLGVKSSVGSGEVVVTFGGQMGIRPYR